MGELYHAYAWLEIVDVFQEKFKYLHNAFPEAGIVTSLSKT